MIPHATGLMTLILAYIASFITQTYSERGRFGDDLLYDLPTRYDDREVQPLTLADIVEGKRTALEIRDFLNDLSKRRMVKKSCSVGGGTSQYCDAHDMIRAEDIMKLTSGSETPGRRR